MKPDDITVVIPTMFTRTKMLQKAVDSVEKQVLPAAHISIATDINHDGAAITRNRALQAARTPWVAFLDDDDWFYPNHLDALLDAALFNGSDFVYSWYDVIGGADPFPHFGQPWDNAHPVQTTITTLVRTDLARLAGFRQPILDREFQGQRRGEDAEFTLKCMGLGAKIYHHPQKTWAYNHHGGNTSGMPDRW
jgi:glycosyltransferase involved in cell wall biosynthesis